MSGVNKDPLMVFPRRPSHALSPSSFMNAVLIQLKVYLSLGFRDNDQSK